MTMSGEPLELALACHRAGDLARAEQLYREILAKNPDRYEARHLLGLALLQGANPAGAAEELRETVRRRPDHLEARLHLGSALMALQAFEEAATCYRAASELAPGAPASFMGLGLAQLCRGRYGEALPCFQRVLQNQPEDAEAHNFLGDCFRGLNRFAEALDAYERALQLRDDFARAHFNRGFTLDEMRRPEEAVASFERALQLAPEHVEAHHNRGVALGKLARYPEAIASFEQALRRLPDYPEARRNRALALLVLGDWERGWEEFEWRWKCRDLRMPAHPRPLWEGEPLDGRTILLHVEQGLGDTLQFIRYAPLVKGRGGRVIVECQKPLVPLVETCPGIDLVIPKGDPLPAFAVHAPLMGLMGIFKTTLQTIPAAVPYLRAEPARIAHWRTRLAQVAGLKVGIAWQGNPEHTRDADRSFALAHFERFARLEGVRLINLQKGFGSEQLRQLGGRFDVLDLGAEVDPDLQAMRDTPALMKGLDLVVTPDTSLAHLAGALGVPVWVALPLAPDWRWLIGREDSPWYPTMRLFRQSERGNWTEVFGRLALEVQKVLVDRAKE